MHSQTEGSGFKSPKEHVGWFLWLQLSILEASGLTMSFAVLTLLTRDPETEPAPGVNLGILETWKAQSQGQLQEEAKSTDHLSE